MLYIIVNQLKLFFKLFKIVLLIKIAYWLILAHCTFNHVSLVCIVPVK